MTDTETSKVKKCYWDITCARLDERTPVPSSAGPRPGVSGDACGPRGKPSPLLQRERRQTPRGHRKPVASIGRDAAASVVAALAARRRRQTNRRCRTEYTTGGRQHEARGHERGAPGEGWLACARWAGRAASTASPSCRQRVKWSDACTCAVQQSWSCSRTPFAERGVSRPSSRSVREKENLTTQTSVYTVICNYM